MKKNMHLRIPLFTLLPAFITVSVLLLLVSCKESSTSTEQTNNFENCGDNLKDIEGNTYLTVQIGNQCWMAEDLSTTKYNEGTSIPNVTDNNEWGSLVTGAWTNNDSVYPDEWGKLYNWYAVNDSRGVCPTGWKVPDDSDWKTLETALGMPQEEVDNLEWRGGTANVGGKMKDTGSWESPNTGATNESGFSARPAGSRGADGTFSSLGRTGIWWSSSQNDAATAWSRLLYYDNNDVYRNASNTRFGLSVRCILN